MDQMTSYPWAPTADFVHLAREGRLEAPDRVRQDYLRSDQLGSPPIGVIYRDVQRRSATWDATFSEFGRLRDGWNGYAAPAPSEKAILMARIFVDALLREDYAPHRLKPSVVGGIAVTHRKNGRQSYVEFYNDGRILALSSDDESEPVIRRVEPSYKSFKELIAEIRGYLDG
jgi:hypothetical protein